MLKRAIHALRYKSKYITKIQFNIISSAYYSEQSLERLDKNITDKLETLKQPKIDEKTIAHLEQLSLVDCANKESIKILEDAIAFAEKIQTIDTTGVEPMYTVLEDRYLLLRNDEVTDGNCQKEVLKNASVVVEDYFVAPPGNIPLPPRENLLHEDTGTDTKKNSQ